jgi:hypothetical protein
MARQVLARMTLACAIGLVPAVPAQAGFLDDLARAFGGARPAPPATVPLEMTVSKPRVQRPRPVAASSKPAPPAVKLDPASDPHWYLRDPTLRKGDIVVTRTGVAVFDGRGGNQHATADFVALGDTRRLPKAQRQTLQAAAAGGRAYFSPFSQSPTIAPTLAAETSAEPAAVLTR